MTDLLPIAETPGSSAAPLVPMLVSAGTMFKDLRQLPSPLHGHSAWTWTILSFGLWIIVIPWYI